MLILDYIWSAPAVNRPPSFVIVIVIGLIRIGLIRYQRPYHLSPIAYHLSNNASRLSPILHRIPKRYEVTLGQTCSRFPSGPVAHDDQMLDLPFFH
jgi:hypothetical protein